MDGEFTHIFFMRCAMSTIFGTSVDFAFLTSTTNSLLLIFVPCSRYDVQVAFSSWRSGNNSSSTQRLPCQAAGSFNVYNVLCHDLRVKQDITQSVPTAVTTWFVEPGGSDRGA